MAPALNEEAARAILDQFEIKADVVSLHRLGGGTKNQNYLLRAEPERYFLRVRHQAFGDRNSIRFDHELMWHLHEKGIGAPYPIATRSGQSWYEWQDQIVELFPFIEADGRYHQYDLDQLSSAGRALGQFHRAVEDFRPTVAKKHFRINPPDQAAARVREISSGQHSAENQRLAACILDQIQEIERLLPDEIFFRLPTLTVHGDFHPGNVTYSGKNIAAFFDLDWSSPQPRIYDVCYGLLYFAAVRASDIDGGDIYSLTQTCRPSMRRSLLFLEHYLESVRLEAEEIDFIPSMMRIAWICCRTDGSQKVPASERWQFFSSGIDQPLTWLDRNEIHLIEAMKEKL